MWGNQFNQAINTKCHIHEPLQPVGKRLPICYRSQAALDNQNDGCDIIGIAYSKSGCFTSSYLRLLLGKLLYVLSTDIAPVNDDNIRATAGDIQIPFEKETKITRIEPVAGTQGLAGILGVIEVAGHDTATLYQHATYP